MNFDSNFGFGNNNCCNTGGFLGFGGSWIWIIILLFICNGDFLGSCGCGCKKKKRKCGCGSGFGFGDCWWIWIAIFFFIICRQPARPVCIPQDDCCC